MPDSSEYQKLRMVKESYAAKLAKKTWEARDRKLAAIAEMDARQFSRERALAEKIMLMPGGMAENLAPEDDARQERYARMKPTPGRQISER